MRSPPTTSSLTPTTGGSTSSRLIDDEPLKLQCRKKIIVVGRPGADTDALADALRKLGYKVYDFKTASEEHARDFALWLEADRLRKLGLPYNRDDYDKLIGNYDALVGAPTGFFNHEFIKLYRDSGVKVIMITNEPKNDAVATLLNKLQLCARFKKLADKTNGGFFAYIHEYVDMMFKAKLDKQAVRDAIEPQNLLEIERLTSWDQICGFLGVKAPKNEALPKRPDNVTGKQLFPGLSQALDNLMQTHGDKVMNVFKHLCIGTGITITGRLACRESSPAAAALLFGICAIATLHYWTLRQPAIEVSPSTSSSSSSVGSAIAEVKKMVVNGTCISIPPHLGAKSTSPQKTSPVTPAASILASKFDQAALDPTASMWIPPHLRGRSTSPPKTSPTTPDVPATTTTAPDQAEMDAATLMWIPPHLRSRSTSPQKTSPTTPIAPTTTNTSDQVGTKTAACVTISKPTVEQKPVAGTASPVSSVQKSSSSVSSGTNPSTVSPKKMSPPSSHGMKMPPQQVSSTGRWSTSNASRQKYRGPGDNHFNNAARNNTRNGRSRFTSQHNGGATASTSGPRPAPAVGAWGNFENHISQDDKAAVDKAKAQADAVKDVRVSFSERYKDGSSGKKGDWVRENREA